MVGGDPLAHALERFGRRLHAGGTADVAHDVGVAVEGHEVGLVGRPQPAQAESRSLYAPVFTTA